MESHDGVNSNREAVRRDRREYAVTRRENPRIRERIRASLENSPYIVECRSWAGSYEPRDRYVIAIEPSSVMAAQRPPELSPAVRAGAHQLPLHDQSVDAAMAVLSIHHGDEHQEQGVRELRRVARGPVVILTCDPDVSSKMWLIADYVPELAELDRRTLPYLIRLATWLGGATEVHMLPVSRDTCDWMLLSFAAHPELVTRRLDEIRGAVPFRLKLCSADERRHFRAEFAHR